MNLKEIQLKFHEVLATIYPAEEIDSLFFILTEHYYGIRRLELALNRDTVIQDQDRLIKALKSLEKGNPVQYIIGETEFCGLKFILDGNVLIPRPETEELVNWILECAPKKSPLRILDIGTGSGCIAIALAKKLPNAQVSGLDVSKSALKIAQKNADLNNVHIQWIETDILSPNSIECFEEYSFDIIVSNPPYVRDLEKEEMKTNVLNFEPHLALFVKDEDPLIFYKRIIDFAEKKLKSKGYLFFEINEYLGEQMKTLLHKSDFQEIELRQDMFNKDRMIKSIRN